MAGLFRGYSVDMSKLKSKSVSILLAAVLLGSGLFTVQSAVEQEPASANANCWYFWDHLDSYAAVAKVRNTSTTYVPCNMRVVSRCTFWGQTVSHDYSSWVLLYPKYTPYTPWASKPGNSCYPYIRAASWVETQYIWV